MVFVTKSVDTATKYAVAAKVNLSQRCVKLCISFPMVLRVYGNTFSTDIMIFVGKSAYSDEFVYFTQCKVYGSKLPTFTL